MDESRLLISPEHLERDTFSELSIRLTSDTRDGIVRAIKDATGLVENHLHRKLLVAKTTQRIRYGMWNYNWGFNYAEAPLDDFPLVQILNVATDQGDDVTDKYSIHTETNRRIRFIQGPNEYRQVIVTAYTGYRGEHHTLDNLQALTGSDLNELPEVLPDDIRSVLCALTAHRIALSGVGQWGQGQVSQNTAGYGTRIAMQDKDYVSDKLACLREHIR